MNNALKTKLNKISAMVLKSTQWIGVSVKVPVPNMTVSKWMYVGRSATAPAYGQTTQVEYMFSNVSAILFAGTLTQKGYDKATSGELTQSDIDEQKDFATLFGKKCTTHAVDTKHLVEEGGYTSILSKDGVITAVVIFKLDHETKYAECAIIVRDAFSALGIDL